MFCPNCGGKIRLGAKFCNYCGNSLKYRKIKKIINLNNPVFSLSIIIILLGALTIFGVLFFRNGSGTKLASTIKYSDLTPKEIDEISKSIVDISCEHKLTFLERFGDKIPETYFGSGTYVEINPKLLNFDNKSKVKTVITNAHIFEDLSSSSDCKVIFHKYQKSEVSEYWFKYLSDASVLSDNIDVAALSFDVEKNNNTNEINSQASLKIEKGEYMPCGKSDVQIGTKIFIFGYPSSGEGSKVRNLIVVEGIISGFEENNYFTTAQIDTGNSGGLTIAKINGDICIVGIPTWINIGEAQILGIVQPFDNVFNSGINWKNFLSDY